MSHRETVNVLIVDDDRAIQRLLADALTRNGFSVAVERDGEWALQTFEKRSFDVVLLDLLLPAINGYEVARRIRSTARGRHTPIILISGVYKEELHRREAVERHGAFAFIEKPLRLATLFNTLKAALGDRFPKVETPQVVAAAAASEEGDRYADASAQEEVTLVEKASRPGASHQAVRGDLRDKPFPQLLAELYRAKASGALLLRRERVKKIVFFREGLPVSIKSNLLSECLGRLMVTERIISEDECEESLRRMKGSGRQQGTVLIEMGCISPHNLDYALDLQLQTKLWDVFRWVEGEYQLNPKVRPPSEPVALVLSAAQVIYEGVKRGYDAERLREVAGDLSGFYVHPSEDPLYALQEAGFADEEQQLLNAVDGHQTVSTLRALALLPPAETDLFLWAMKCAQMVELADHPAEGKAHLPRPKPAVLQPPPLRLDAAAHERSAPTDAAPARAPVRPRAAGALLPELAGVHPVGADEGVLRERLATKVAAMRRQDSFQNRGSSAHDTRADPEERQRDARPLESGTKPEVSGEVAKILAAEGRFQKGEALIRQRKFDAARHLFEEAIRLYDQEGEFHAWLGWAIFLGAPADAKARDEALEALDRAISLNPRLDWGYLFTGYIFKATGRPDKAERQFEKAIQCNPDCTEALRELRLLGRARS